MLYFSGCCCCILDLFCEGGQKECEHVSNGDDTTHYIYILKCFLLRWPRLLKLGSACIIKAQRKTRFIICALCPGFQSSLIICITKIIFMLLLIQNVATAWVPGYIATCTNLPAVHAAQSILRGGTDIDHTHRDAHYPTAWHPRKGLWKRAVLLSPAVRCWS